jgi:hypothetical protein
MNITRTVHLLTLAKEKNELVDVYFTNGEIFNNVSIQEVTKAGEVIGKRTTDDQHQQCNFCYFDAGEISCITTKKAMPMPE